MFFILSKILQYLIYPLTWIIIIFLFQVFSKNPKRKKILFIVNIILFWIFSNGWLISRVAYAWDYRHKELPANTQYSCAILLNGIVGFDKHHEGYFNPSCDRFIQTAKLYHEGKVKYILTSGGEGSIVKYGNNEAVWLSQQLQKIGVPKEAILIEGASRNTLENGSFSKRILDSMHLQPPYVLVTSAFHMRRSMWVFNKENIPVIPYSANYFAGVDPLTIQSILPQAHALDMWNIYTKEMIGYVAYNVKSWFNK